LRGRRDSLKRIKDVAAPRYLFAIFCFVFSEIDVCCSRSAPARGAYRDRHERGAECGGREDADRRTAVFADGQVVWFWRPEAGAKSAMISKHRAGDGDNKVWLTGKSAK
jgi:hypothetical protein